MTKRSEIYKCENCGILIHILKGGKGNLDCCNNSMVKMVENTVDASGEKHVPVIEKLNDSLKIKVGEVSHPMDDDHYIEWIELISNGISYFKFLKPSNKPEAIFKLEYYDNIQARAYCNLHGLWKD